MIGIFEKYVSNVKNMKNNIQYEYIHINKNSYLTKNIYFFVNMDIFEKICIAMK